MKVSKVRFRVKPAHLLCYRHPHSLRFPAGRSRDFPEGCLKASPGFLVRRCGRLEVERHLLADLGIELQLGLGPTSASNSD